MLYRNFSPKLMTAIVDCGFGGCFCGASGFRVNVLSVGEVFGWG
jgi:hypothetical protein